jgi:hypothetical protein
MGSSNSQPTSKQNYTPPQEMDPAVKQFLQNLNMFTNTVCQQPSGSGTNVNQNTVVFYPADTQQNQYNSNRCQNPNCQNPNCQNPNCHRSYGQPPHSQSSYIQSSYIQSSYGQNPYSQSSYAQNPYSQSSYGQSPYGQSPYSQSPYTDEADSMIVFQTENYENYENSKDSLNYGTMKDCWKKQNKYTL